MHFKNKLHVQIIFSEFTCFFFVCVYNLDSHLRNNLQYTGNSATLHLVYCLNDPALAGLI